MSGRRQLTAPPARVHARLARAHAVRCHAVGWLPCSAVNDRQMSALPLPQQVTGPENQQLAEQLAASEAAAAEAQQQLEQERHRHAAELAAREAAAAAARKEAERERRRLACRLATSEETAGVARRELQREAQRRANQVAEGERAAAAAAESARKLEGKVARLRRQLQEEQQARAQQVLGIQQQQAGVARALGEHTAAVQRLEESTQRAATALQAQVRTGAGPRWRCRSACQPVGSCSAVGVGASLAWPGFPPHLPRAPTSAGRCDASRSLVLIWKGADVLGGSTALCRSTCPWLLPALQPPRPAPVGRLCPSPAGGPGLQRARPAAGAGAAAAGAELCPGCRPPSV